MTLARLPSMSLAALPLLLTDAGFRRRVRAQVDDPIGLGPFWASFEAWSEAERTTAVAPSLNKLRPLLMRPELRAVIGQVKPRFDLRQVFTERKVLLVNLARGQLGPETAALLGSLIMSQLWQAILGRSAIAPERRHPVFIYVDEFQEYLRLPVDFADALAQARGLGAAFWWPTSICISSTRRCARRCWPTSSRGSSFGCPARTPGSSPPAAPWTPKTSKASVRMSATPSW